ncbi:hypothetical protein K474DRAFT_1675484 [Panus rudis PR-1116 ss-1]|nr:hypothetical protein K474DRAFT_1675484 [Panus rudis PR-1116 ss-1]
MYPCVQPSDAVAFRAALTKYMDGLKNNVIRPTKSDSGKLTPSANATAWWWKNVIVRKSTLEECAGERFELLMLALSTHALLRCTPPKGAHLSEQSAIDNEAVLKEVNSYSNAVFRFDTARRDWEQIARSLSHRQQTLQTVEASVSYGVVMSMLRQPGETPASKYASLATNKLLSLRDSILNDLRDTFWSGEDKRHALKALLELYGLTLDDTRNTEYQAAQNAITQIETSTNAAPVPPLPIAAAHHPTQLQHLRQPIVPLSQTAPTSENDSDREVSFSLVVERLAEERKRQESLRLALVQAKKRQAALQAKCDASTSHIDTEKHISFCSNLPDFTAHIGDLNLKPFNLAVDASPESHQSALGARIVRIRDSLPAWPAVPDPEAIPPPTIAPPIIAPTQIPVLPPTKSIFASKFKSTVRVVAPDAARKAVSRKSNVFKGRARRSSAFLRGHEILLHDEDNLQKMTFNDLDESTSFEMDPVSNTPRPKITKGIPLTPLTNVKHGIPRRSFDMDSRERSLTVALPRMSRAGLDLMNEDDEDGDEALHDPREVGEEEEDVYEGNSVSMTLKEILLNADATQFNLLGGEQMLADDSLEYW